MNNENMTPSEALNKLSFTANKKLTKKQEEILRKIKGEYPVLSEKDFYPDKYRKPMDKRRLKTPTYRTPYDGTSYTREYLDDFTKDYTYDVDNC